MRAGGIFGGKASVGCAGLGSLGISPPFPDVYGCNEDSQCQSGWCNTSIPVQGANGQCQTRGKVNPGVGGDGKAGSVCSSDDNCTFGLTCNMSSKMCESASDPGNVCYIADQMGFQDGLAGLGVNGGAASQAIAKSGGTSSSTLVAKAASCYAAGYARGKAQAKLDTRPCLHVGQIQQVQRAIGTSPTGTWSKTDAAALARTGKSFKSFAPNCTGAVPAVALPAQVTPTYPEKVPPAQPGTGTGTQQSLMSNPLVWAGVLAAGIGGVILLTGKKKGKGSSKVKANRRRR
jgi:hypothetical protein